jgi:hypothetical protein
MPRGVYPKTEEHRRNLSKALKGKPKLWLRGDENPSKRPEVVEKINVAKIGDFATPKEGVFEEIPEGIEEAEEIPEGETTEEQPQPTISPEELKEKLIALISEAGSKGLSEEEKKKFIDDFKFWNGILFNFLDIGNNLGTTLEKVKLKLTPGKAVVLYVLGTSALLFALRPDLAGKVFGKKKKPEEKPPEKPIEEVPPETPKEIVEEKPKEETKT